MIVNPLLSVFLPVAVFVTGLAHAAEPSFDCSKAKAWSEFQVCNDEALATLDREVASLFFDVNAHSKNDARQRLIADQKAWLREREDCRNQTDQAACLRNVYKDRIAQLSAAGYSRPTTASNTGTQLFYDPHEYCRTVIRSDDPTQDGRYKGPRATERMATVFGVPFEETKLTDGSGVVNYMLTWRCAAGAVLACYEPNTPMCGKADIDRTPTTGMAEWCRANPDTHIPAAVTGHYTVFDWKCGGKKPLAGDPVLRLDAQGFARELWKKVP